FRRPGPRHRRERGLRRSVRRASRETDDAGHAGDVDDAALASGRHPRGERGHEQEWSAYVAGEEGIETLDVELLRGGEEGAPGDCETRGAAPRKRVQDARLRAAAAFTEIPRRHSLRAA